jgi:hypothetical protein
MAEQDGAERVRAEEQINTARRAAEASTQLSFPGLD